MLVFRLLLGISKFFLILKLTPVWRNSTNSQHNCGPKHRCKEGSRMVLGCIYLSNAIFKMRIQEKVVAAGLPLFPHAELTGYAFFFFF